MVQVDPSSPLVARQQGLAPVATHLTTVIQASKNVATNNSNTLVNVGQTNLDTSLQGGVGSSTPKPMSTVTIGATASNATYASVTSNHTIQLLSLHLWNQDLKSPEQHTLHYSM